LALQVRVGDDISPQPQWDSKRRQDEQGLLAVA
jgi:hypothetical protein